ncbi:MAG: EAL domain-containing protein [Acidiferrobacterales bacterium]
MEKKILRLLIVDDSPDDADLPVSTLRKSDYMLKSQRVQDMAGMQAALAKAEWDLVISEYQLPHFGAILALDTLKHSGRDLPFIVVTKAIHSDDLAKVMRAGARDVLLKDDLVRLVPVIERELTSVAERGEYRQTNERLHEIENKHQAMIDGSREAICYSHEGMHVDANRAYLKLFGYEGLEELEGIPVLNLIDKSDHAGFKEYLRKTNKKGVGVSGPQIFTAVKKDSSRLPVEVSMSLISLGGESCTQIVVVDLSRHAAVQIKRDEISDRDDLTGAHKREYFLEQLGSAIEQAKGGGGSGALVYIELDGLKEINEKFGSSRGDRLLSEIGSLFINKLGDDGIVSRFGGDEFAVLLAKDDQDDAQAIAKTLNQCVEDASSAVVGQADASDCTLGLIMIDETAGSVEKILSLAYGACEQAKKRKKPSAPATETRPRSSSTKDADAQRLAVWRNRIQHALDSSTFQLVYQPIINLIGDPSEYYEVLIRMPGDNDELISAGEFMAVAEESGQASAIDEWVVEHALKGLVELHQEGQKASFFVNLSMHAPQNEVLVPLIQGVLKESDLAGEHLILETDETLLDNNFQATEAFMQATHKLGCRHSLDNFGARLALLGRLRELPVEFLKIDGALVRNCAQDNIKQLALKTIVQAAKILNKKTIGKCVEDEETLSLLYSYELDYLQGNYFQHADTAPEFNFGSETTLSSEDADTPNWPPAT